MPQSTCGAYASVATHRQHSVAGARKSSVGGRYVAGLDLPPGLLLALGLLAQEMAVASLEAARQLG